MSKLVNGARHAPETDSDVATLKETVPTDAPYNWVQESIDDSQDEDAIGHYPHAFSRGPGGAYIAPPIKVHSRARKPSK